MATFSEATLPRKRIVTYGKPARKHLPSYDRAISGREHPHASERKTTADQHDFDITPANRDQSPPQPSKDIFEFSASDDEVDDIPQKKKRRVGAVPLGDDGRSDSSSRGDNSTARKLTGSNLKATSDSPKPKSPQKTSKLVPIKPRAKPPVESSPSKKLLSPVRLPKPTQSSGTAQKAASKKPASITRKPDRPLSIPRSVPQTLSSVTERETKHTPSGHSSATPSRIASSRSSPGPSRPRRVASPTGTPQTPNRNLHETPSSMPSPSTALTPKGKQMWDGLLGSAFDDTPGILVDSRPDAGRSATPVTAKPRRRLIDALAEQTRPEDSGDEQTTARASLPIASSQSSESKQDKLINDMLSGSQSKQISSAGLAAAISQHSQSSGPKFTYGSQRTYLEEDLMSSQEPLEMFTESPEKRRRRGSISNIPQLPPPFDEDLGEGGSKAAIRSVHELRQAGANNRLVDEVEDILDRIGKPGSGSARRSGLMDLIRRLGSKDFSRLFRDGSYEQRLFINLGEEKDVIAGCLVLCLLLMIIPESSLHAVVQLLQNGITNLLLRLIDVTQSLAAVAKARSSNLSKMSQSSFVAHEKLTIDLPVWEEVNPSSLSPRTLSLKCLETIVRKVRESGDTGDAIPPELSQRLFDILQNLPETDTELSRHSVDFELTLSTLESHSITAMTSAEEELWIKQYLPRLSTVVHDLLQKSDLSAARSQNLALRLTLNVTNNNLAASEIAATEDLMMTMGRIVVEKFKFLSDSGVEDERTIALDQLILTLGVLINFAEWCPSSRRHFKPRPGKNALDDLLQVFAERQERTAEAESVEEVMENVAFGYLAVFLGFLALDISVEKQIRERQPSKSLRPLLSSIDEFIHHNKRVDEALDAEGEGHNPQAGLTERLERMVSELKARRA